MLDFSFSEVGLVGLVALIAIGPERMPKVARGAGVLFGRFRRYTQSVKAEIDRELLQAEMKEVERKIAEAKAEAERQLAASATAVDHVLKQPVLAEGDSSPVQKPDDSTVSAQAAVEEFLVHEQNTDEIHPGFERPKVGYASMGGDPFSVRRAAPARSRAVEAGGALNE